MLVLDSYRLMRSGRSDRMSSLTHDAGRSDMQQNERHIFERLRVWCSRTGDCLLEVKLTENALPAKESRMDRMGGMRNRYCGNAIFSEFDLQEAYLQFPLHPDLQLLLLSPFYPVDVRAGDISEELQIS